MSARKKLFVGGIVLVFVSALFLLADEKFLNCVDQPKIFPALLGFADTVINFSVFLIPIGLLALYIAFVLKRRNQGKTVLFIVYESVLLFLLVAFGGSIILASQNTARSKGRNAATMATIANMRAMGEIYLDAHGGTYSGFCTSKEVLDAQISLQKYVPSQGLLCRVPSVEFVCNAEKSSYAVSVKLFDPYDKQKSYFCVDSTGLAKDTERLPLGTSCK